ncbi:MAG: formimidoylglutamate deiminase [Bacteroidota bacterium]
MKKYRFKGLLQNSGWLEDVSVSVDEKGLITAIDQNHESTEFVSGLALPGFQNAHSHAFQYAMAGLTENHGAESAHDDFWSWRETMYQIALMIDPEELESIATMLYSEMVRHGYTHVAEFHYLHHDKDGKPYSNLAEHGDRLVAAAQIAGIKITLIPMFYQTGGFGKVPGSRQRRFISKTVEDYHRLWEASKKVTERCKSASIGYGIHSIRAVEARDIKKVVGHDQFSGPFHIHVAEQLKEIEDCLSFYGNRPVEWLIDNTPLNENCHLVHATHLIKNEIKAIATRGACVVLCPSTEGNLGDGIFPLHKFQELGGRWSIGTDSHIGLNPCEELRILDYGQRLTSHRRNTFTYSNKSDHTLYAFDQMLSSGRAAMGHLSKGYFELNSPFDAVIFDAKQPLLANTAREYWLPTLLYSADASWIKGTIIDGRWVVENNLHKDQEKIRPAFTKALKKLALR